MRYVYIDEAGVSKHERVRVVSGIIVHPDHQWRAVQRRLAQIYDEFVPPRFRKGFVFHAKHIYGMGEKERAAWASWKDNSRWSLMESVLSIPMEMKLPIVLGMVRKDSLEKYPPNTHPHDFDHGMALFYCVAAADEYLRRNTNADEVATVVSEDVQKNKKWIKRARQLLEQRPLRLAADTMLLTAEERRTGKILQSGEYFIERIVGDIHFENKDGVPLLQIADACAFAFRRFFSEEKDGNRLLLSLLKAPIFMEDYAGPASNAYFVKPPKNGI